MLRTLSRILLAKPMLLILLFTSTAPQSKLMFLTAYITLALRKCSNRLEITDCFLKKRALELGAADAQVIRADQVVVEDRVVLKCKVGCNNYGKTLACPPYTPSAEEFRKIVSEYSYALFMKFTSKAEADPELQKSLSKSDTSTLDKDIKEKAEKFWAAWKEDKKDMLASVVKLEKEAMRQGYSLAISFVSGSCQ